MRNIKHFIQSIKDYSYNSKKLRIPSFSADLYQLWLKIRSFQRINQREYSS